MVGGRDEDEEFIFALGDVGIKRINSLYNN